MKFSLPLAVIALAGNAAAQSTPSSAAAAPGASCEAEYIVTRCLQTEKPKVAACKPADYECLCAAHEAVSTCYNNCPDDPRAASALSEVKANCQFVTTSSSSTTASATKSSDEAASSSTDDSTESVQSASTTSGSGGSNTAGFDQPEETDDSEGAAGALGAPAGLLSLLGVAALFL
ncbi:hypothetical protein N3K66_004605 [Trichothecium roseum]|uniref:Uncharacterized protein n=1 Tax=Trichothecium roseum TaxID=47278 RepID=A0ACC0V3E9_9HYPO|nr:hypothetical protein N3K66_004605 [Trichothecium roseum]